HRTRSAERTSRAGRGGMYTADYGRLVALALQVVSRGARRVHHNSATGTSSNQRLRGLAGAASMLQPPPFWQALIRIDTLLLPALTTARSRVPSPVKPPIATERAPDPTLKFAAASKLPSPVPDSSETVLEVSLAAARSSFPSRLKSPTATETGRFPTPK